jgi:CheY-like chemotaxis protein
VIEASNGVEAIEVWRQRREEIQLLLTDMVMPGGVNGRELAGQLRGERPDLKVIFASGYSAEVAGPDLALKEGFNFLSKPFALPKLAETLRRQLDSGKGAAGER